MVLTVGRGHSLAVRLLRVAFSLSMHAVDLVLTLSTVEKRLQSVQKYESIRSDFCNLISGQFFEKKEVINLQIICACFVTLNLNFFQKMKE